MLKSFLIFGVMGIVMFLASLAGYAVVQRLTKEHEIAQSAMQAAYNDGVQEGYFRGLEEGYSRGRAVSGV